MIMSETTIEPLLNSSVREGYHLLRNGAGHLLPPGRGVVELRGGDRKGWLQGQVTNDLRHFQPASFLQFCMCSPTGQLEAACSLWGLEDRFIIASDANGLEVLRHRVEKMVILEDVTVSNPESVMVNIQGPLATERLAKYVELPSLNAADVDFNGTTVTVLRSNRTGSGGWVVLIPKSAPEILKIIQDEFPVIDSLAYKIACLEFGTPTLGVDTNSKTLPPELGPMFESATINYKKGCYQGQEVLMRIHSRGHVNKIWMGLYTDELVQSGDPIFHPSRGEVGVITSAYESPDYGFIAAGYVRRETAYSGEEVVIHSGVAKVGGELVDMPILKIV